jgi:hypothetical protein
MVVAVVVLQGTLGMEVLGVRLVVLVVMELVAVVVEPLVYLLITWAALVLELVAVALVF